ncbi:prostatic acid phosphatase-like [Sabethes cyaneus]|uniref:prostatic acid phosphatase-like n=1 Tax=Sabethes cyaneus TaxID=53552 RepID=UPI00237EB095|nr:prostatic acid phosphatase-like [Sabethes cyaneus]
MSSLMRKYMAFAEPVSVLTEETSNIADEAYGKLIFAHVIFRHGNRTPIVSYPTDPYRFRSNWTNDWGQLTNIGKHVQLELGRWLRQRYRSLLSNNYDKAEIYVQSSESERVLMSALANLAGLYPPLGSAVWEPTIAWQPIPVYQIPRSQDNLIAATKTCPQFKMELERYLQSEAFQSYNKSLAVIYEYLTKHTQLSFDSFTSIYDLYNILDIESTNNKTLPAWSREVFPEPLRTMSANLFRVYSNTTRMARLKMGPLLKDILDRFQQKINKTLQPDRTIWMYSAHDITIANLLNGMHMFKVHNPPFAACLLFELRASSSGVPYVSIYYRDSAAEPEPLYIPRCGKHCPLQKLIELYQHLLPNHWDQECLLKVDTFEWPRN